MPQVKHRVHPTRSNSQPGRQVNSWRNEMKAYELPPLDYDFAALEPHYSARVLELHHDKHHKAYVDGVNTTLEKLAAARASDDLSAIVGLEKTLAFNLSGHVLHTLFWQNLTPK